MRSLMAEVSTRVTIIGRRNASTPPSRRSGGTGALVESGSAPFASRAGSGERPRGRHVCVPVERTTPSPSGRLPPEGGNWAPRTGGRDLPNRGPKGEIHIDRSRYSTATERTRRHVVIGVARAAALVKFLADVQLFVGTRLFGGKPQRLEVVAQRDSNPCFGPRGCGGDAHQPRAVNVGMTSGGEIRYRDRVGTNVEAVYQKVVKKA